MTPTVLIGGGASITEGIQLGVWQKIQACDTWSLNYAFRMMPYLPTRELWVDHAFFDKNMADVEKLWKQGVKLVAKKNNRYAMINHCLGEAITQYEESRQPPGFQGVQALRNLTPFMFGGRFGLVGVFALSVAMAERRTPIFLLGYDFGTLSHEDNVTHFYQDQLDVYSTGIRNTQIYLDANNKPKAPVEEFNLFQREAEPNGITIYNVSLKSHITAFPKISYQEFFHLLHNAEKTSGTE